MVEPDRMIWKKTLAHLRINHPDLWRQWFEEIEPMTLAGGLFRLRAASTHQRRFLQRDCARAFSEAAQAVTGRLVAVRFEGEEDEIERAAAPGAGVGAGAPIATRASAEAEGESFTDGDDDATGVMLEDRPDAAAEHVANGGGANGVAWSHRPLDELVLIPDYTFDNFVTGPGNRLAHAAAVAIAENPGKAYNPMFIHGGVGLGKTHLLQAVCRRILDDNPRANIVYISCEDFITRFMEAVQAGRMAGFRHHFRHAHMLVIDDIHFLGKRERTQEEFFHTFNSLHQTGRQIILSSDAPPDQIPDLEDRLVSRFKWGLVAQIEAPDYETRVAIVMQKAKGRGVELEEEVACLIAGEFDSNIRELEGALTKIQSVANLDKVPIDIGLARRALEIEDEEHQPRVTIETIVEAVTSFYDVSLSGLQSKRRHRSIALPRQVCMYLARKFTRYSLEEIGGYFGGRDHTTVIYAVKTVTELRETDTAMDRTVGAIESQVVSTAATLARRA